MHRRFMCAVAVAGLACLHLSPAVAAGSSGSVDDTFADRGITWLDQVPYAVAIQPDGKIVVAGGGANRRGEGGFALTRYNRDGTLDRSFSGDGEVRTPLGDGGAAATVAIQPDGRIVAAGGAQTRHNAEEFAVARYLPDGSFDTSFSGDGKLSATRIGSTRVLGISDIALDPSGGILASAYIDGGNHYSFGVIRLTRRGVPDATFSSDGVVASRFGRHPAGFAEAIALQSDGSVVVVGSARNDRNEPTGFAIARYLPNGTLDGSFDGDGKRVIRFGGTWSGAADVAIQQDGRMVVAGTVHLGPQNRYGQLGMVVARCFPGGALDTSFAGDGKRMTTIDGNLRGSALAIQSDGRIVIGGEATPTLDEYPTNMAIVRYTTHGTLDSSFAGDGIRVAGFRLDDWIDDLALQSNGKIVVVGASQGGPPRGYAVARFLP